MSKLSILFAAVLALSLAGCGTSPKEPKQTSSASGSSVTKAEEAADDSTEEPTDDAANESTDATESEEEPEAQQPAQDGTEAPEAAFSITPEEVEAQVEFIRTCYYTPGPDDAQVTLEGGENGWEYSRDYRYHNGELIFAFIYEGTMEHRLYFKDGHMIRYIDENHNVFDFGQLDPYYWWEQRALAEGNQYAPEGSGESHRSAWWGTYEGDDGETLVVTEVTADHVALTYNGWTASGQEMFHSSYVLGFLDADHTMVGESDEVLSANGWRYEFTLDGNRIVMSSRSPDRSFYRQ